jgi:transcriptional regulator with PAS, ATPase and Fis domain
MNPDPEATRRQNRRSDRSRRPTAGDSTDISSQVSQLEVLCRKGKAAEVLASLASHSLDAADVENRIRILIARGTALNHVGNVVQSIDVLREAVELAESVPSPLRFAAASALFVREAGYQAPDETLPGLSALRQTAASLGDANSLGSLHVVVARLEACRGKCIDARGHLRIARQLAGHAPETSLLASIDLAESGLEIVAGNLQRARQLAAAAFERANEGDVVNLSLGSISNLGTIAMYEGKVEGASRHLTRVFESPDSSVHVRLGTIDSLAQLALLEGDDAKCGKLLGQYLALSDSLTSPSPSWGYLSNAITRCSYWETSESWGLINDFATNAEGEMSRRQLNALRTSLLCSRARALSRLGSSKEAISLLATAFRSCPRGAMDPLIVLEASRGVCLSLKGEVAKGSTHFDRALASCRAIGHRFHERWIERDRRAIVKAVRETVAVGNGAFDVSQASVLLADASSMFAPGQTIEVIAHHALTILRGVFQDSRIEIRHAGSTEQAERAVVLDHAHDGRSSIRFCGEGREVNIAVRDTGLLDEVSVLRSVAELARVALRRSSADDVDEDQNLWPPRLLPADEEAVFQAPRMTELVKVAIRLAATDLPVLIAGETGTGKEVFARLVHLHSRQKQGPFVAYNCSAMPRDLVESQLFGHRRGAFTGATDSFQGIIRAAERGTLFLDEIGDLELTIQPKLLRFLEASEIHPIGEVRPQRVALRVIAATNAPLEDLVNGGSFRRDLFYRLGVATLTLPPLRERKEEIPALAALFLARYSRECQRMDLRLGDDLVAALLLYDWPGNVRQLANEIRRLVAMADNGDILGVRDLAPEVIRKWNAHSGPKFPPVAAPTYTVRLDQPLGQAVAELEREFINRALAASGGKVTDAARFLGISRKGLFLKRKRWRE